EEPLALEAGEGVGVQHLAPQVAVVPGRVPAREDVREAGDEVVVGELGARATGSSSPEGSNSTCRSRSTVPKESCRIWKCAAMKVRAATIFPYSSAGMGSPLSQWRANRSSASRSHVQFSMICEGSSTQSEGTCVPPREG